MNTRTDTPKDERYRHKSYIIRIDKTSPTESIAVDPTNLWPPNHKMREIIVAVMLTDNFDLSPAVVLTSIVSNEPDNGLGDGDTPNDIQGAGFGTDDREFLLRADMNTKGKTNILSEKEIDEIVLDQANNDSAWEKPVRVRKAKTVSVPFPSELAARASVFCPSASGSWCRGVAEACYSGADRLGGSCFC